MFLAFNISIEERDRTMGLGFVYLIDFGHKFSSMLNDQFNYVNEELGLNLAYIQRIEIKVKDPSKESD